MERKSDSSDLKMSAVPKKAPFLAAALLAMVGCNADKATPAVENTIEKTLTERLHDLASSRKEIDPSERLAFDVGEGRGKVVVNLIGDRGVSTSVGMGFHRCEDDNGDGIWEKINPLGCSHNIPPADAYFDLKDQTKRPAKWKEMQKMCNERARLVLDQYGKR